MAEHGTTGDRCTPVDIPVADGEIPGLIASPEGLSTGTAIVMVHENKGLTRYMLEVLAELADLGYLALAPNLMSRVSQSEPDATTRAVPMEQHVADIAASLDYVASLEETGDVALVGFCFGAEAAMLAALDRSDLAAVVAWYGIPPAPEKVERLSAPLLLMLAHDDDRVNRHVEPFLEECLRQDLEFVAESYPGTLHAFHDRYRPERFNAVAAAAAWDRCVEFLDQNV